MSECREQIMGQLTLIVCSAGRRVKRERGTFLTLLLKWGIKEKEKEQAWVYIPHKAANHKTLPIWESISGSIIKSPYDIR